MNKDEAWYVLELLVDGIDPVTGEILPPDHVCGSPTVLRALHKAICALKERSAPNDPAAPSESVRSRHKYSNLPWSAKEDAYLKDAAKHGMSLKQMSFELPRSPYSIQSRMIYLGLADRSSLKGQAPVPAGCEHHGLPWYPEDDDRLTKMFQNGSTVKEMSAALKRTTGGILSHLVKLGLIDDPHSL